MPGKDKLGFALSLFLAGSTWFYVQHILIPHQQADAVLHGIPRGNLSDLYPRWLGSRELLLNHRDPYGPEVTREIQAGYYGRPLDPTLPNDPKDQQAFAYPAYVAFLLAPSIGLPFPAVLTGFRWFLIALTIIAVLLWLRTLRWRPSCWTMASVIILTLGSFQVLQGIKLQQLSLLVAGLIAGSAVLLTRGHLPLAGVLIALATIKPQLVLLLTIWLLLWAFSDWRRRQGFVWGFAATLLLLFAAAEHVLPHWLWRFQQAITAYRQYNDGAGSLLDVLLTPAWGRVVAALIVLALLYIGWRMRRALSDSPSFVLMFTLVLVVTVVVAPKTAPYNQVLLVPAILLVARDWQILWQKNIQTRAISLGGVVIVFWPWVAATVLTMASLVLPTNIIQQAWAVPMWTSLAIPLAVVLLLVVSIAPAARSR
jgi:hypothetical protein